MCGLNYTQKYGRRKTPEFLIALRWVVTTRSLRRLAPKTSGLGYLEGLSEAMADSEGRWHLCLWCRSLSFGYKAPVERMKGRLSLESTFVKRLIHGATEALTAVAAVVQWVNSCRGRQMFIRLISSR